MHADEYAVASQADVALQRVCAIVDGAAIGSESVLRFVDGGTAMGDDLRPDGHVSMLTRDGDRRATVS
ncbi:MAG TPA: hypothetical protein VKJ07_01500 [Mycobacteriales bacterium]|nr:hypothetical protein [Mycobacteriales bacterium]